MLQSSAPRPVAPEDGRFTPAHELAEWAHETFVSLNGPLHNPDHEHLLRGTVAFLWAGAENAKAGRQILGMAQLGQVRNSDAWLRGQREQQLEEWFGRIPDFLITIDAGYWMLADDAQACALIEHELYHCGQLRDEFGMPCFNRDGMPIWTMRSHDVEEFVGVVARYGAEATYLEGLRAAFERGPTIAPAEIGKACGTCMAR
ncbi:MAG: putative metallopeptidase [Fimbriimonas sp.]